MTFRRALSAICAMFAMATGLACGPSFQAIYEGNARFEHCYALEETAHTALDDKAACWHDWSQRYTFGQTRDRIHYATARYVALSQSVPTDEAMMMAAPGMAQRASTITAPTPTNAFAPPPKVLEQADASAGPPPRPSDQLSRTVVFGGSSADAGSGLVADAGSSPVRARLPGSDCGDACGATFSECKGAACEKTYRACVRACMK